MDTQELKRKPSWFHTIGFINCSPIFLSFFFTNEETLVAVMFEFAKFSQVKYMQAGINFPSAQSADSMCLISDTTECIHN